MMTRRATASLILAGLLMLAQLGGERAWSQQARTKKTQPALQCDPARFRAIIDVGHTPEVPGAISARGATEYEFNLRLARVIEKKLTEQGFARTVLLVASGPAIPSLLRRVAQANAMSADLMISIHHDSVPEVFKTIWEFGGKKLHYSDRFKGHSIFVSAENTDFQGSLAFGKLLGGRLKARGLTYAAHYTEGFMGHRRRQLLDAVNGVYRYDQLLILKTARMPTVLLEAGSIINRDEELLMAQDEHQAQIAGALAESVERFCALKAAGTVAAISAH